MSRKTDRWILQRTGAWGEIKTFAVAVQSGGTVKIEPRVIARRIAPKQPRGISLEVRVSPLGCFASLAMTRVKEKPFPPFEGERVGSGGSFLNT